MDQPHPLAGLAGEDPVGADQPPSRGDRETLALTELKNTGLKFRVGRCTKAWGALIIVGVCLFKLRIIGAVRSDPVGPTARPRLAGLVHGILPLSDSTVDG